VTAFVLSRQYLKMHWLLEAEFVSLVPLTVDDTADLQDLDIMPFDVTLDDLSQGQLYDFPDRVRATAEPSEAATEASLGH